MKSMGTKKQGGNWKLRLWFRSDHFPMGQETPHTSYTFSVSCHLQGHDCPPVGIAWVKVVICKHLAQELFYKMGKEGKGGRLCDEDRIATQPLSG